MRPEARSVAIDLGRVALGARYEGAAVVFRQVGVAIDIGDLFEKRPGQLVVALAAPIRQRREKARQCSVAVGLAQFAARPADPPLFVLDRPVAQHDMRKIEVEFVRRHIRALGHEAHVAQRAGVGDLLVVADRHAVELAGRRIVDQLEQARERIAQIEAAPAAVTDVEDAPHLRFGLAAVGKIRILPPDHMTRRRVETAFSHPIPLPGRPGLLIRLPVSRKGRGLRLM